MIRINCSSNIKQLSKGLSGEIARQVAFASVLAVNAVAKDVQLAEQDNMRDVLDRPTPFTIKSVAIQRATKRLPVATVFVKDIAARYLEPYEAGGLNILNGRALLKPKGQGTNQYGNLPRRTIASLQGRSDIYIGKVKTRRGVVDGVWQRSAQGATVVGKTGKVRKTRKGLNSSGKLKLLIAFTDAHPVKQRLHWREVARGEVDRMFDLRFRQGMARAWATRK